MRVVIAVDSFKGSISSLEAGRRLAAGFRGARPDLKIDVLPLSDGGEGLVESLVTARGGRVERVRVTGPLGDPVEAPIGFLPGGTVVLEMAAASGLPLVPPEQRNPFRTTTRGTGELVRSALDRGVHRLVMGIGGSATTDGGAGMLQALGMRLTDAQGRSIGPGAAGLETLARVEPGGLDPRVKRLEWVVAGDVDNPLCGPRGAAYVYGPQKGARPEDLPRLDAALARWADKLEAVVGSGPQGEHRRWRDMPGAGAAGGLGFALMAACGARLEPGAQLVLREVGARRFFSGADLVVTGEGRLDASTLHGKLPVEVARLARDAGARVVAVCGSLDLRPDQLVELGIESAFPLVSDGVSPDRAQKQAGLLLEALGQRLAALLAGGRDPAG